MLYNDWFSAVAVDASRNVFVAGAVGGALPAQTRGGLRDVFLQKFDSAGTQLWVHQFGTAGDEWANDLAVDASGNVVVAGTIHGNETDAGVLPGQTSAGGNWDAFVRKYSASGAVLWTRQFGTSATEGVQGVAIDGSGNVFVVGGTTGALPGQHRNEDSSTAYYDADAFLRKYDVAGNEVWTRQFGTTRDDAAHDVAVDTAGNIVVAGSTAGTLIGPFTTAVRSAFLRKYDSSGGPLWTVQFGAGTSSSTSATTISIDPTGGLVLGGSTTGTLADQTRAGGAYDTDAFVQRRDSAGALLWTGQFGTSSADTVTGVAADASGRVFVCGDTSGSLPTQVNASGSDGFVVVVGP